MRHGWLMFAAMTVFCAGAGSAGTPAPQEPVGQKHVEQKHVGPPTPRNTPSKAKPGDPYAQFFPDNTHIPFFTPDAIPWVGEPGREQQYLVYGDTKKPGPYALMLRWFPGAFSKPHFHGKPRYVVVLSGTWWVSSSTVFDPSKTYPIRAGSVVSDELNTVHWDGAKDEPVTLLIVGEGPVPNVLVDENGKPTSKTNF